MTWEIIDSERRSDWTSWIKQIPQATVYQQWGWGDFKGGSGGGTLRLVARTKTGVPVGLAQAFVRKMPGGMKFIWIPGGPLCLNGDVSSDLMAALVRDLEKAVGRCYLRCNFMEPLNDANNSDLAKYMSRPAVRMLSGYSVFLDLNDNEDLWLKKMEKKHRYYVRHSRKNNIEWQYGNDDNILRSLADLSEILVRDKGLNFSLFSYEQLVELRRHLADSVKVIVGRFEGEPITAAMVLTQSNRGHYSTAATTGRGRDMNAAYAMLAELRIRLRNDGITLLDFGGIAPRDKSCQGVNHFKLGFGGEVVEYLGEWEAGSRLARFLGNLAVRIKRGGMG
jgi:lipid II:glycine glycyltransferase (peptidoglycan interpeptide bridge formation enzyme)